MKNLKPFEAGKTIKELNIDVTRKFIVVNDIDEFKKWTILTLEWDDGSISPKFTDGNNYRYIYLSNLAYYEEEKEEHSFKIGDKVKVVEIPSSGNARVGEEYYIVDIAGTRTYSLSKEKGVYSCEMRVNESVIELVLEDNEEETKPSYVVYVEWRQAPSKIHNTLESAKKEALRLAKIERSNVYIAKLIEWIEIEFKNNSF